MLLFLSYPRAGRKIALRSKIPDAKIKFCFHKYLIDTPISIIRCLKSLWSIHLGTICGQTPHYAGGQSLAYRFGNRIFYKIAGYGKVSSAAWSFSYLFKACVTHIVAVIKKPKERPQSGLRLQSGLDSFGVHLINCDTEFKKQDWAEYEWSRVRLGASKILCTGHFSLICRSDGLCTLPFELSGVKRSGSVRNS